MFTVRAVAPQFRIFISSRQRHHPLLTGGFSSNIFVAMSVTELVISRCMSKSRRILHRTSVILSQGVMNHMHFVGALEDI